MKKSCKRHGSIYVARNTVTGDCYVGQTIKPLPYRIGAHKASAKKPKTKFGLALAEFGFAQFIFSELFIAFDRGALNEAEKHFINDLRPVYNSTIGGAGTPGRVVSAVTKEKLRMAMRTRWNDPEYRNRVTKAIKESCSTDEHASRCREIGLQHGGQRWANHVKKLKLVKDRSVSMKAAWANPAIRQRMISAIRSANLAPEHRARLSVAGKGRVHSKAAIEKIAAQKYKPVLCPELQVTFLSRKYAAEWVGACRSAITTAIQQKGKVFKLYTFCEVN
jgi:group I intron endonuclease